MKKPRGRLAPSPTGVLHLGNARSFLLAWLDLRSRGGEVVLRVEDLDGPRNKPHAAEEAMADLKWLGLDWDEGPFFQRDRIDVYREALQHLCAKEWVYPCICSRKDVEEATSAPHENMDGLVYPGTCRSREIVEAEEMCWRFRIPNDCLIEFQDRFAGPQSIQVNEQLGDFVVWNRNDDPAYQLAVVVDDHAQGVNEVLRGADLLPSTARQLLLHEALGLGPPQYAHVPLVRGADGRRLAKRHGDTTLRFFREQGWSSERMLGFLASWSGLVSEGTETTASELLKDFELKKVVPDEPVWSEPTR
ncbi:MAG TPA: tRNA glutamyl-Q(34) synthetase GluQRS [Planctomycetota bacterium]|nr:tRNA glutamyl-Q(34) synthetase GluQRS [Planctomycetota bacterium]HJM40383.1 tRNA glutamyl-Q(34) synthetase GluQRS [Planctomycetota bacterium]